MVGEILELDQHARERLLRGGDELLDELVVGGAAQPEGVALALGEGGALVEQGIAQQLDAARNGPSGGVQGGIVSLHVGFSSRWRGAMRRRESLRFREARLLIQIKGCAA